MENIQPKRFSDEEEKQTQAQIPASIYQLPVEAHKGRIYGLIAVLILLISLTAGVGIYFYYISDIIDSNGTCFIVTVSAAGSLGCFFGLISELILIQEYFHKEEIIIGARRALGPLLLVGSFFVMIVAGLTYVALGFKVILFQADLIHSLRLTYDDNPDWFDRDWDEVKQEYENKLVYSGYLCFLVSLSYFIVLILIALQGKIYGVLHRIFQAYNMTVILLGLGIIAISYMILRFREEVAPIQEIDWKFAVSMVILGFLLVIIELLGYSAAWEERKRTTKVYIILSLFSVLVFGVGYCGSLTTSSELKSVLQHNCLPMLSLVDEEYLAELGCEKYESEIDAESCEKDYVALMWEVSSTELGCLNQNCCDTLSRETIEKINYLSCLCLTVVVALLIGCILAYILHRKIVGSGRSPRHQRLVEPTILVLLVLASIGCPFALMSYYPVRAPTFPGFLTAKVTVRNGAFVDERLLNPPFCRKIPPIDTSSFQDVHNIEGKLIALDGSVYHDKQLSETFEFTSKNLAKANSIVTSAGYCGECEYNLAGVDLYMNLTSANSSITEYTVHYNYHYSNTTIQNIKGSIYNATSELQADVGLTKPACGLDLKQVTSAYDFPLQQAHYSLPYLTTMSFNASGHVYTTRTQHVGGLPFYPYTLPPVILPESSLSNSTIIFSSYDIHSVARPDYVIYIREGYNTYTGDYLFYTEDESIELPTGVYSLQATSHSYKDFLFDISVTGNTTLEKSLVFTPDDFKDNEIRALLTWDSLIDLDLKTHFTLNEEYTCDMHYANIQCGSVRLSYNSKFQGEELQLKEIGAIQYLFYIESPDPESSMPFSNFKLDIYIPTSNSPIVSLSGGRESSTHSKFIAFCLDGARGVTSLHPIQQYTETLNTTTCSQVYGGSTIYSSTYEAQIEVSPPFPRVPPNIFHPDN